MSSDSESFIEKVVKPKRKNITKRKPKVVEESDSIECKPEEIIDDSQNIINIKTGCIASLKLLFETLKDVLMGDINLFFTKSYIKVQERDGKETVMVHLNLDSEAFAYYHCEPEVFVAGVNATNIYKLIKTSINSDTISFIVTKENSECLKLRFVNSTDHTVREQDLKLLDIPYETLKIPKMEFPFTITLPSAKFQKYMKDFNNLGTDCVVDIATVGQRLILSCQGDFSYNQTIIGANVNNIFSEGDDDIVQGSFWLKFLVLFTKATNISSNVKICMKNDFPMILEYMVGSLGTLRFIIKQSVVRDDFD